MTEYFDDIGAQIALQDIGCLNIIRRAFRILNNLVDGGRAEFVSEMMNECNVLNSSMAFEVTNFYQIAAEEIAVGVLMGTWVLIKKCAIEFLKKLSWFRTDHIDAMCQALHNSGETNELLSLSLWFREEHREHCNNITFAGRNEELSEESWESPTVISGSNP